MGGCVEQAGGQAGERVGSGGKSPTARVNLHRQAVQRVARILRRKGHRVVIHVQRPKDAMPGDLFVDGSVWVGVRGAMAHPQSRVVRWREHRYEYSYLQLFWNLHVHGSRRDRGPDIWALVDEGEEVHWMRAADLHGLTFTMLRGQRRPKRCQGRECHRCHQVVDELVAARRDA